MLTLGVLTPDLQAPVRADYPMAAPSYSRQRSELAKHHGLGRPKKEPPRGRTVGARAQPTEGTGEPSTAAFTRLTTGRFEISQHEFLRPPTSPRLLVAPVQPIAAHQAPG
jgi:hypothetical protein